MSLTPSFEASACASFPNAVSAKTAPFSVRFTAAERERLQAEAGGLALGSYIRAKLLSDAPLPRKRGMALADRQALAKALGLIGQTHYASNLNQLARLANMGALPLTPEVVEEIASTLKLIAEVRALIIQALGGGK